MQVRNFVSSNFDIKFIFDMLTFLFRKIIQLSCVLYCRNVFIYVIKDVFV